MQYICEYLCICTLFLNPDETDYTEIQSNRLDVLLFYDDTTRRECFTVDITNDVLVEGEEQFSMILLDEPGRAQPIDTEYLPNTTVVTIIDADSMWK